jgi:hydrolase, NUDIX family
LDDAAQAKWFPLTELPDLAFDHKEILQEAERVMGDG